MDALEILLQKDREQMQGMFVRRYGPLRGRDWIRNIPAEDREVLIRIGLDAMENGRLGGIARAKTALRDRRGRFAKGG